MESTNPGPGRGDRANLKNMLILSPLTGLILFNTFSHGCAVGYFLSPLRG
jgi:hypothetical protein